MQGTKPGTDASGYYILPKTAEEVTALQDIYFDEYGRVADNYAKIWGISPWTRVHIQFNVANHVGQCKGDCLRRSTSKFSPWNCITKCRYGQDHWILSCHADQHEQVCSANFLLSSEERLQPQGGLLDLEDVLPQFKQRYYDRIEVDNNGDLSGKLDPLVVNCRHCHRFVLVNDFICPSCYLLNPQLIFQYFSRLPNLLVNTVKGPADQQYADHLIKVIKELSPESFVANPLPVTKQEVLQIKPEFKDKDVKPTSTNTKYNTDNSNNNDNNNNNNQQTVKDDECQIVGSVAAKRKIEDTEARRYFVVSDDDNNNNGNNDNNNDRSNNNDTEDNYYLQKRKKQKTNPN